MRQAFRIVSLSLVTGVQLGDLLLPVRVCERGVTYLKIQTHHLRGIDSVVVWFADFGCRDAETDLVMQFSVFRFFIVELCGSC